MPDNDPPVSELDNELGEELFGEGDDLDGGSDEGEKPEGADGDDGEDEGKGKDEEGEGEAREAELLDADDEDEELAEAAPFNIAAFNKKHPNVLKENPELRMAIIREQRFTEVFPTIEDAQEAYDRAESFKNFENELGSGQSENLLRNIARLDYKAYEKFTTGVLKSVQKLTPDHYNNIVGPMFGGLVQKVYRAAMKHNDENLAKAAQYISGYVFDEIDPEKIPIPKEPDNDSAERSRNQSERQKWHQEKFNDAADNVTEQVRTNLMGEITKGIDPHGKMNDLTKEALAERIYKEVDKTLEKDQRHCKTMRLLWERAGKAGFTAEWRNKIRNAYLTNAQRILPEVRTRIKAAAFKNSPKGTVKDTKLSSGKPAGTGNKPNGNSNNKTSRQIDYSKTSDLDLFNDKVTYKK